MICVVQYKFFSKHLILRFDQNAAPTIRLDELVKRIIGHSIICAHLDKKHSFSTNKAMMHKVLESLYRPGIAVVTIHWFKPLPVTIALPMP